MADKPTLQDYMLPILELFADGQGHAYEDIPPHLQAHFDPMQNDTPGRAVFMMNAALGYFKKALVLEEPEKHLYRVTERGTQLLGTKPTSLTVKDLRQFPEFDDFIKHRRKPSNATQAPSHDDDVLPEDALRRAYTLHRESLSEQLQDRLRQSSWRFFEMLVSDLLVAMGYGDPHDDDRLLSGPGDEGIDGMINQDPLGLERICIQAKKWENAVGRPEIQKFAGSLDSRHAQKGVFITTSRFSAEAREYVQHIDKRIVLIDGQKLGDLMVDYNVGVSAVETYTLKQIDTDYFVMAQTGQADAG